MTEALRGVPGSARALRWAAWVAALVFAASAAAQDSDAAEEALKKGDLIEARAQLGRTVAGNPADCNALLAYAATLPPKEALRVADSLSRAPNAPGWAKARGLRFSGDHLFLNADYKKAADAYLQASKFDTASAYRHFYALSIAMDGQTEAARTIWNGLAQNKADELSGEAARVAALLPRPAAEPANPPPAAAVVSPPNKVDSVKAPPPPAAPVVAAPASQPNTPAAAAVKADSVKPPPPAAPANPPAATVGRQNDAPAPTAPIKEQPAPVNPKPAPAFTIQVGAFASKENADNLVKRLTGKYDDITVSIAGIGDQTLYRVRVGTFQKKEDATAFADKLIIEAGLSARVTEK